MNYWAMVCHEPTLPGLPDGRSCPYIYDAPPYKITDKYKNNKTLIEIKKKSQELNVYLPFAKDTRILAEPLNIGSITLHNRMGIAPMEGADSLPDGSPSDYTQRRYEKEAVGGSAIIWFVAISIVEEGRSSKSTAIRNWNNIGRLMIPVL